MSEKSPFFFFFPPPPPFFFLAALHWRRETGMEGQRSSLFSPPLLLSLCSAVSIQKTTDSMHSLSFLSPSPPLFPLFRVLSIARSETRQLENVDAAGRYGFFFFPFSSFLSSLLFVQCRYSSYGAVQRSPRQRGRLLFSPCRPSIRGLSE